ncbi:MAG TPA: hypothetical protein VMH04_05260 [Candidatus Solibacter sp.]|nr:hypothetical protein [Candidatus Solibacter sp.]
MNRVPRLTSGIVFAHALLVLSLLPFTLQVYGQSCQTAGDLDDATRSAISGAAQRFYDLAAKGDAASIRQNSIPSLASDFSGIESTVVGNKENLAAAQPALKSVFLLETQGTAPSPHAEFYCGVFGKNGQTSNSAVFYLDNLPPGKYGIVILTLNSAKASLNFSTVLQQAGSDWKLGGLYIRPSQVGGHDSEWFAARAREYKSKGQMHDAWFFFQQARALMQPLPFMSTMATDKIYDESQGLQPADLPANGKMTDLAAGGTTYKLSDVFVQTVGSDLDLVVRYQTADASNTATAYQNNLAVMKAFTAKYPEVRDAFAGMVARGVDPNGRDYGTLLAMKDIK